MPGRLAGFAMLARRLDSFAQTREIIVIGMARRFVEVLDELMHARSLLGLSLGGLRVAGANAGGHAALQDGVGGRATVMDSEIFPDILPNLGISRPKPPV